MRSDKELDDEMCEGITDGEALAMLRALRRGGAPAPDFRAQLKQSVLAEAQSDARRRKAYKLSILGLPRFYVSLAAVGATAALVLMAFTYNSWFRPVSAPEIAETLREPAAVSDQVLGRQSGALGFAPPAGSMRDSLNVVSARPLTDEVWGIVEQIACEAGGSIAKPDVANEPADAVASTGPIVLMVPSDVLDHVLDRLDVEMGLAEVAKPSHLNSAEVAIYITSSPD